MFDLGGLRFELDREVWRPGARFPRDQIQRRALRRKQPRHHSVLECLSVSCHFLLSSPPQGCGSYRGNNYSDAGGSGTTTKPGRVSFETPELLWKVLTARRWGLLKALCGVGPVSIREAARRVGRDIKTVHGDVTALLEAGVLDRTPGGAIKFPYDAIKVEFLLQAA